MNNRPLFWAVMCFALGEVAYIIAGRGYEIGTAVAVLICAVFLLSKISMDMWKRVLYLALFVVGFCRIWQAENDYVGNVLFGNGEYAEQEEEYEGYRVSYVGCAWGDESYVAGVSGDADGDMDLMSAGMNGTGLELVVGQRQQVNVSGVGVVDNMAQGSNGYNITVKLVETRIPEAIIAKDFKVIIYGVEYAFSIGDVVMVDGVINDFVPSGNPGEFNRRNYYKARGIVGYGSGSSVEVELVEEWTSGVDEYGELTNVDEDVDEFEELTSVDELGELAEYEDGGLSRYWYRLKQSLYELRIKLSDMLYQLCDEESAGLYSGLLLGDKNSIPDDDMLLYRLSGIAHIFSISALHIGIVGGLLYKLLRKLGLKFLPAALVAMLVTLMYGVMTGFSFPTIRAIIMLGLSLGGEVLGRKYDILTGMGLALGVLIVVEPFRLLDGGLILSFGAVTGVVVSKYLMKVLEKNKRFARLKKKDKRWIYGIISALVFSVGISLVTAPLIAYMYFQIPFYSVLLNMLIVPLMTLTVYCGFFGVLLALLNPVLGKLIIYPGVLSLRLYQVLCKVFQKLPLAVVNTGKTQLPELVIYYVVLGVCLVLINPDVISWLRKTIHRRTMKWLPYMKLRILSVAVMVLTLILGTVSVGVIRFMDMGEEIIFLDVGQGDGTLIKTENGTNMVIDVGSSSNDSLGEYVAYPGLLAEGMGHVDYWFVSHPDTDHISGLEYLLESQLDMGITIDNLVVSQACGEDEALIKLACEKDINVIYMKQGDYITDGSFTMKCIHPSDDFESEDKNEQSLVLSYESEDFKILFTGDVGVEAIENMLDSGVLGIDEEEVSYDILKVPHHGSKNSLSMDFLELISPDISVISCGKNNRYGHPHKETVEGLETVGSKVMVTSQCGAVRIIPD